MDTRALLVSLDTCVLMMLAEHSRPAWQAVKRLRAQGMIFVVPPNVLHELGNFAGSYANTTKQRLAADILDEIGGELLPDFSFGDLNDSQFDTIFAAAARLRRENLLPYEEWHDHLIICEAAALGCAYLLTNDTHLLGVPQPRLAAVLRQMGLPVPRIISYHSVLA